MRFSVIVCAHNEAQFLRSCLHSLLAQSRTPDEILVINNASTDSTRTVAEAIQGVRVVDESRKRLPQAEASLLVEDTRAFCEELAGCQPRTA